jgi:transposase
MSTAMAETTKKSRRPRRRFDEEFKAQAVRLVLDEGKTVGAVARDLDLTETALREWVHRARADRAHGRTGLTTAEREELARLRQENRQLRLEREILKNAALFRISLARLSSKFSRWRRFNSSRSLVVKPGRWPVSRSAWRTQRRSDSVRTPSFSPTDRIVAHCDRCSGV